MSDVAAGWSKGLLPDARLSDRELTANIQVIQGNLLSTIPPHPVPQTSIWKSWRLNDVDCRFPSDISLWF